jgi:hypothetical protein
VGKHGDKNMIAKYVKNQGKEYANIYKGKLRYVLIHTLLLAAG